MSWDAYFNGQDWNYTHNTNKMIAAAYEATGGEMAPVCDVPLIGALIGPKWWERLEGMTGKQGAAYLGQIISGLEADPARFRAMNPPNGWGSYDGLLGVLREMRDAGLASESETRQWEVSG